MSYRQSKRPWTKPFLLLLERRWPNSWKKCKEIINRATALRRIENAHSRNVIEFIVLKLLSGLISDQNIILKNNLLRIFNLYSNDFIILYSLDF
jgi:hypothetical protein